MQESEDTMSLECSENVDSPSIIVKPKPKKRSIVERELETSLTEKITSPVINGQGNTSRYGRSRRSKANTDWCTGDIRKIIAKASKSPKTEHVAYKMYASNSPVKINNVSPIRAIKIEQDLDDQIANIYNENIMLSRFGSEKKKDLSPVSNVTKVYVRKDLIQKKEKEDTVMLIKDMFSPSRSNSHLNNILERDSKYKQSSKSPNTSSVVKTLDFDGSKSKKREADKSNSLTKSELFEMEAKCDYQVGDLAWARMGTFPFWPCFVTRDPLSGMFVKKKLFGRVERDVLHVTFFGDNGRRGWIVDNMLRPYAGVLEFEATRDKFTPDAKKKDPRLYAAFFVSEKRLPQWKLSIEEAETLHREPKRLRFDVYNEMLSRSRPIKTIPKSRGKVARADSDVSLSESLYDTLFSEDDGKSDDDRSKNKRKTKSFDVSDVVTACLDNMAAKTGITKIQRQSHMDRWLQKAKSKTPEKNQLQKLSKSLLLDTTPKKVEQAKKNVDSKRKRKSMSSIEGNRQSQRNRLSLNRSININQTNYGEDTNSFQTDSNDSICNGDQNDIEIFVNIPINLTSEDGFNKPIENNIFEKEEDVNNHQIDIDTVKVCGETSNVITEIQLLAESILKSDETSVDLGQVDGSLNQKENSCNSFINPKTENQEVVKNKNPHKQVADVNGENSEEITKNSKICENIDYSKINGHQIDQEMQLSTESDGCKIRNNNYKKLNAITMNGVIDHFSTKSINNEEENHKSNEVEKSVVTVNNDPDLKHSNLQFELLVSYNNIDSQAEREEMDITESDVLEQTKDAVSTSSSEIDTVQKLRCYSPMVSHNNNESSVCRNDKAHKPRTSRAQSPANILSSVNGVSEFKDTINTNLKDISAIQNLNSKLTSKFKLKSKLTPIECVQNNHELLDKTVDSNTLTSKLNDDSSVCKLRSKSSKVSLNINRNSENKSVENKTEDKLENGIADSENTVLFNKRKREKNIKLPETFSVEAVLKIPEFVKYLELKQDSLKDENPELAQGDIVAYLYKTWQYGENSKSNMQKTEEIDASSLVKGTTLDQIPRFRSKRRVLSVKVTRHIQEINENSFTKSSKENCNDSSSVSSEGSEESLRRSLRHRVSKSPLENPNIVTDEKSSDNIPKLKEAFDETDSIISESSRTSICTFRSRASQSPAESDRNKSRRLSSGKNSDEDYDPETECNHSESSLNSMETNPNSVISNSLVKNCKPVKVSANKCMEIPEFVKYLELKQDHLLEQNPDLTQDEITAYLYKTWQYEENSKSEMQKTDEIIQSNLVKGANKNSIPNSISRFRKRVLRIRLSNISPESEKSCDKDNEFATESSENIEDVATVKIENDDVILEKSTDQVKELDETTVSTETTDKSTKLQLRSQLSKESCVIENQTESAKQNPELDMKIEDKDLIYIKEEVDDTASIASQSSELSCKLRFKSSDSPTVKENESRDQSPDKKLKAEYDPETASVRSEDSTSTISRKRRGKEKLPETVSMEVALQIPEFVKYLELRQDSVIDENPELSNEDIVGYLYKTWLYEESTKSDFQKTDEIDQSNLVKGLNQESAPQAKRIRKKIKKELKIEDEGDTEVFPKEKRKRNVPRLSYIEDYIDTEDEIQYFEIFQNKGTKVNKNNIESKNPEPVAAKMSKSEASNEVIDVDLEANEIIETDVYDEVEEYFQNLSKPKPNVFKGLVRERVCEICEKTNNLVKCKCCHNMFHINCVNKETKVVEVVTPGTRGRKKKKPRGRKPKNTDSNELDESHSDGKSQDHSIDESHMSIDDIPESKVITNVDDFEAQLEAKMKEMLDKNQINYDSYSSDELCWSDTEAGKCKIVDVKLKPRTKPIDLSDFKCKDCQKYDTPVCFVCKNAVSKTGVEVKQKCNVAHCNKYYHLQCLEAWPQTQFSSGEPSRNNKKINEHFEALTCPRHVCHTCVCDDPRGCKTRFSGDKLARCVRCPATYHSFTKCLPAGSQILTGSHIICPRHYENRPGKVPCHVNTGWCFICALGGSLICCEYCPTSFHAECLNIKPPEGGYMCEDCETGRLPLYGEMVWVKLGHYRWWPGMVLHPSEIPENILAVKHSPGEFVVRFFGQYDHYWVNRGRVFPFQEGDSGRISSQKSKIDADFTMAMEHAQRACEILKSAPENEEECSDIASSLLPPHYVKLKVNKPSGALVGKRVELDESSLTQCECAPSAAQPCGPNAHCLNRMLLTECGPTCRAGERCHNRAFEKRQYPRLVPYRTPWRGWGLKTLEMIPAGAFVIEYVGELIDEEELRRRMARQHAVRDENYYFLTLDKERVIDAGPKGNLARFMNHCCEPNCETQKWTVLGDVRVGLFAIKDIPPNTEVTFNYNFECVGIEKKKCLCGAKRCSGYIGAKPKQDESQTKKTLKPNAKRSYKKKKPEQSPSTKKPRGRPAKPRELTDIEKDLLIIKSATNGLSSDSDSSRQSVEDSKALKRKRVSFSTEESSICSGKQSPNAKRMKIEDNAGES